MKWKMPPRVKIYEALGALVDGRVKVRGNEGRVESSKGDKTYTVKYDGESAIMTNDNGSYWQGYLGYPAIAFLMELGKIDYDKYIANALKEIAWNDVNKKFKRDYEKTVDYCLDLAQERGIARKKVGIEVDRIYKKLERMGLDMLGKKMPSPKN